jgi:hypothetical protein
LNTYFFNCNLISANKQVNSRISNIIEMKRKKKSSLVLNHNQTPIIQANWSRRKKGNMQAKRRKKYLCSDGCWVWHSWDTATDSLCSGSVLQRWPGNVTEPIIVVAILTGADPISSATPAQPYHWTVFS